MDFSKKQSESLASIGGGGFSVEFLKWVVFFLLFYSRIDARKKFCHVRNVKEIPMTIFSRFALLLIRWWDFCVAPMYGSGRRDDRCERSKLGEGAAGIFTVGAGARPSIIVKKTLVNNNDRRRAFVTNTRAERMAAKNTTRWKTRITSSGRKNDTTRCRRGGTEFARLKVRRTHTADT